MSKYISAELIKELMKHDRFMQGNAEMVMWQQEVDRQVDSMPSIEIVTLAVSCPLTISASDNFY